MKNTADVGLLDGVRWDTDEVMMHSFPTEGIKKLMVYVDADADHRYARMLARNRTGEAATTRDQFDVLNKRPNEIYIPEIGARADLTLTNNYENIADFEKDIEVAYEKWIRPLL